MDDLPMSRTIDDRGSTERSSGRKRERAALPLQGLDPQIQAVVEARHADPFAFLGMHQTPGGLYVRAILPGAEAMDVIDVDAGKVAAQGVRLHPDGFFVALSERSEPFRYRLRVQWGGNWHEFEDIYRFSPVLGELDIHLLVEGNHLASYQKLGAQPIVHEGIEGVTFAVWA